MKKMSADFSFITSGKEVNIFRNKIKRKSKNKIYPKYKTNTNFFQRNPILKKYNYTYSTINSNKGNYNLFPKRKIITHIHSNSNTNTTKSTKILYTPNHIAFSTISNPKRTKHISGIPINLQDEKRKEKSCLTERNSYYNYKNYCFDNELKKSLLWNISKKIHKEKPSDLINNIKIIRKINFVKNIYNTQKDEIEFQMMQTNNLIELIKISFYKSQNLFDDFNSSLILYLRYLSDVTQKEKGFLRSILIKKKDIINDIKDLQGIIKELKLRISELKKMKALLIEIKFITPKLENINDEDLKKYGVIRCKTEINKNKINNKRKSITTLDSKISTEFHKINGIEVIFFFEKNSNIKYYSISNPPIFNSLNEFFVVFNSYREKIISNINNSIYSEEDKIYLMKELIYSEKLINADYSNYKVNEYYYQNKLSLLQKQNQLLKNKIISLRKNENLDDKFNKRIIRRILKILTNPYFDIKINDFIIKKYGFTGISETISCLNNNDYTNKFFVMNKQESSSMYVLKIFEIIAENIFIIIDNHKNENIESYKKVKKEKEKEKILLNFELMKIKDNLKIQKRIEKMNRINDATTFISKKYARLGTEDQNNRINLINPKKIKKKPKAINKLTYEDIDY